MGRAINSTLSQFHWCEPQIFPNPKIRYWSAGSVVQYYHSAPFQTAAFIDNTFQAVAKLWALHFICSSLRASASKALPGMVLQSCHQRKPACFDRLPLLPKLPYSHKPLFTLFPFKVEGQVSFGCLFFGPCANFRFLSLCLYFLLISWKPCEDSRSCLLLFLASPAPWKDYLCAPFIWTVN